MIFTCLRCATIFKLKPAAYEAMWAGGVVVLPHPDTVRKEAAQAGGKTGRCPALLEGLRQSAAGDTHTHARTHV